MAESVVERRFREIRRWRLHRRRYQLRDHRICCLADLEDLHQAGGRGTQAELSVLPDVDRHRCYALPALHQPAHTGLIAAPTPEFGSAEATSHSRAPSV